MDFFKPKILIPMRILSLMIVLLLFSCTSQREIMDSYLGTSRRNVILNFGPPDNVYTDKSVGEILIYGQQKSYYNQYNGQTMVWWDYQMFYIQNDKVYSWRTSRETVAPQQLNMNVYFH